MTMVLLLVLLQAQPVDAQALQRMAATERAFAAATAEIGVRDGFLTFFAEDSVTVEAGKDGASARVSSARTALAAGPQPSLPLAGRLMWEPFTGHVSSDGSFGWLTGGYASVDQASGDIRAQGAYFSVWKRQGDGTWKVWLDEGIGLPEVWRDASPFRAAPEPDAGDVGAANEPVEAAERTVVDGAGWRARLSRDVRLHRDGRMPIVGRDAAAAFGATWTQVRHTVVRLERAGSDDLAVVIGGYDATVGGAAEHGTFVRVWKRDVTGRWRIVFETSKRAS